MAITTEQYLDRMLEGYVSNYNIFREEDPESPLKARAELHMTESQVALFKEVPMWSADSDEYCYFYCVDNLSRGLFQKYVNYVYDDGLPKVDLEHRTFKNQHMCTRLVLILICNSMDDDAASTLRKSSIYKSFLFSLKGWMEVHTVAVDLGKRSVISNRYGKDTAKYMKNVLSALAEGK